MMKVEKNMSILPFYIVGHLLELIHKTSSKQSSQLCCKETRRQGNENGQKQKAAFV